MSNHEKFSVSLNMFKQLINNTLKHLKPSNYKCLIFNSSWDGRPFGHNRHGRKEGVVPLSRGQWPESPSIASGVLIHPAVWPQWTLAENWGVTLWGGELSLHITQCCLGRGLPPYQVESWCIQPFGHNTPKLQIGQRSHYDVITRKL